MAMTTKEPDSRLRTAYLGLDLRSPVILGSSPLSGALDNLRKAEDNGAGAVVVRSLFEELIESQTQEAMRSADGYLPFADGRSFLEGASRDHYIDRYLRLVQSAKKALDIPVVASICCDTTGAWIDYAKRFEASGADALELNYYILASDASVTGAEIDRTYLALAKAARKAVRLPVALKIGRQFSGLANMIRSFAGLGVDGLVLFNHFLRPDIDIEKVRIEDKVVPRLDNDHTETLRWIALMAAEVPIDFCASTGIADGATVVKMLLAGAKAAQVASAVFKGGFEAIGAINAFVSEWMDRHGYSSLEDFRGILAQERIGDPGLWERSQYIKLG